MTDACQLLRQTGSGAPLLYGRLCARALGVVLRGGSLYEFIEVGKALEDLHESQPHAAAWIVESGSLEPIKQQPLFELAFTALRRVAADEDDADDWAQAAVRLGAYGILQALRHAAPNAPLLAYCSKAAVELQRLCIACGDGRNSAIVSSIGDAAPYSMFTAPLDAEFATPELETFWASVHQKFPPDNDLEF